MPFYRNLLLSFDFTQPWQPVINLGAPGKSFVDWQRKRRGELMRRSNFCLACTAHPVGGGTQTRRFGRRCTQPTDYTRTGGKGFRHAHGGVL